MESLLKKANKILIISFNNLLLICFFNFWIFTYLHATSKSIIFYPGSSGKNISAEDSVKLKTPVILTKGKNNYIIFHTVDPILKWTKVKGANGYTIYIDDISNKNIDTSLFRSYNYGLITTNVFRIFDDLLEFNKSYKVRIRAYNKTQWSNFSDSVIIRIEVPKLDTPQFFNINKTGKISFNSTTPIFNWSKIKNANGYTVYVDEISNNKSDTVIISSHYGLVSKNQFIPLENTLQRGNKYRIRVRAYNEYTWSKYSKPLIFGITKNGIFKSKEEKKPKIKSFITENNVIKWNKIKNAQKYLIIVEAQNESDVFAKNYQKIISNEIADTSFHLTEKNLSDFRWKIKAKIKNKWTPFTKYYSSASINLKNSNEKNENYEEIFLNLKYMGLLNEMIVAAYKNNEVFIPAVKLLSWLKINHSLKNNGIITGIIDAEKNKQYIINFNTGKAEVNGKTYLLQKDDFIKNGEDFLIKTEVLNKLLNLNLQTDMKRLIIKIKSLNTPLYKRLIDEKELSLYKNLRQYKTFPLLYKRKRHLLKGFIADYNFNANFIKNQNPSYSYQLGLAAEVFGGDAEIFNRQILFEDSFGFNQLDARWRYAFINNRKISSITLGNNNTLGIQPYDYRGIKITNEPLEERKIFGKYKIEDITKPNWTVEIYKNNRLIDITKAGANGKFIFYLPFLYGNTLIELHLLGPNGEYEVVRKMYQIPVNQVPEKNLDYSFNLGELINGRDKFFQGKISYGLTDWLTTTMASDVFINDLKNSSIYNVTTARIFNGSILNFTIAPNALASFGLNSLFTNLANININATLYDKNEKLNPAKIKNEISASIFYPYYFKDNPLSFLIRAKKISYNNSDRYDFSARSYLTLNNFMPSVELNHFEFYGNNRSMENTMLNFRLNYSFMLPLENFTGNIVDIKFGYDVIHEAWNYFNLTFSTTVLRNIRVQLSHTENFNTSFSNTQLNIIYDLPFLRSATTVSNSFASQTFSGSFAYMQNLNDYDFNNRAMIGKSAAAFRFFLDDNNNNIFDKGEKKLSGMDIEINSVGDKKKKTDGTIFISQLDTYSNYQAKIIEHKNLNPNWKPVYKKFSFVTDPNNYKTIDIPFYEAAEISGSVFKIINGKKIPVIALTVIVRNIKSKKNIKLKTLSDGSFYTYGIQPGSYKIYPDNKQLKRMGLTSEPGFINATINPINSNTKATEYNFTLVKK